jgi:glycerol uptake facilitator-like aquaporin
MTGSIRPQPPGLGTVAVAEAVGTAVLLAAVIGSGVMAEQLSQGNVGVALLANTLATVFVLVVLIETLGPVSGAHFNPLVSMALWLHTAAAQRSTADLGVRVAAQALGAVAGAWLAHAMFSLALLQTSTKVRNGPGLWLAEVVATAGLIWVVLRSTTPTGAAARVPVSVQVACWIGAAYWFTASTSFANPVAVLGRSVSDTFAGIAPASAIGFVAAQAVGCAVGMLLFAKSPK